MTMRRRRARRPAELTPLIDVLFILLFASLIQARSAIDRARADEPTASEQVADAASIDAGVDATADAGVDASVDASVLVDAGAPLDAAPPTEPTHLTESRELANNLAQGVYGKDAFVVEVREDGYVVALSRWSSGREVSRQRVRHRLVRPILPGESGVGLMYLPPGDAGRICPLVRAHIGASLRPAEQPESELSEILVLVILDVPLDDVPLALYRGLQEDLHDCFATARGIALLLQPGGERLGIP